MGKRALHDGRRDGLVPLKSLCLDEVTSFRQLLEQMSDTAFSGRQLGEAYTIVLEMFRDPSCHVVLTVSGAMTVAKQGQIICDLIDRGLVHTVVATGALIAHGLTESIGLTHYRYDTNHTDESLYERGYNRIYDTLEMESNLNDVERIITSVLDAAGDDDVVWSSSRICRAVGRYLSEQGEATGILRSAYEHDVPVFIPAFTDSEMGLDVATWSMMKARTTGSREPSLPLTDLLGRVPSFNPFLDLQAYTRRMVDAGTLGILTVGGGVPRNWAQQVGPYVDVANERLGTKATAPRFQYGVRICPEPAHWGGLSGCTYSEGVSWGKFVPSGEGGRFAEVYADATVAWPLLTKAVFEELDARNP